MEANLLQEKIHQIRGRNVMIDFTLADLYNVTTKSLNQAVKRNIDRFPSDFMFHLNGHEWANLKTRLIVADNRSQFVTGSQKHRNSKFTPLVFTEQGVAMLSSVLRSKNAVQVNIGIMRAFVMLRQYRDHYKELALEIKRLEREMNIKFGNIYEALEFLTTQKRSMAEIGFKQQGRK